MASVDGIKNFQCSVCDTVGNWKNVDEFRHKAHGMSLCMTCGFITYPEIQMATEDLTNFYRDDYREAPNVNNLFAGERKLHYHAEFLSSLFETWKEEKRTSPDVIEIGAAFGMFLKWFKQTVPGVNLYGTELTKTFRRNAWWLYGIRLDEQPDWGKKYDLIASYKVAEHIPNIDKELRKYALGLKPNGHLYISVPTWFRGMTNFGLAGFSLEYYYHKNHINVWTRKLFEEVLRKAGLKPTKYNDTFYDDTYLCIRDDSVMSLPAHKDDPKERLEQLRKIKEASVSFDTLDFDKAIELWPFFPDAHINRYEKVRGKLHKSGFEFIKTRYLDKAIAECPNSNLVHNFVADLYLRYEQFDPCVAVLAKALDLKPNEPQSLSMLGHCYRQMAKRAEREGDLNKMVKLLHESRQVMSFLEKTSKQCSPDAMSWIMQDNAMIPAPFENQEMNNDTQQVPIGKEA